MFVILVPLVYVSKVVYYLKPFKLHFNVIFFQYFILPIFHVNEINLIMRGGLFFFSFFERKTRKLLNSVKKKSCSNSYHVYRIYSCIGRFLKIYSGKKNRFGRF